MPGSTGKSGAKVGIRTRRPGLGCLLFVACVVLASCGISEVPGNVRNYMATREAKYPWTAEPIDEAHKQRLCQVLALDEKSPFCQPQAVVVTTELVEVVERRFPINKTLYEEVAQTLQGFPVAVEESVSPEGEVTSRSYAYLLTQFEGFCVYFDVDLKTSIVTHVDNTKAPGVFDGGIPTRCGPARGP